jgi:predicted lysophospholipase L1 biosynthesis ABC-type transport system permease subunit
MIRIYTIEFATLGLVSALIAGALASGFGSVALSVVFQSPQIMNDWHAIAASIGIAIPAVVFAGWLPTNPLLRRKPMDVLRRSRPCLRPVPDKHRLTFWPKVWTDRCVG